MFVSKFMCCVIQSFKFIETSLESVMTSTGVRFDEAENEFIGVVSVGPQFGGFKSGHESIRFEFVFHW